MSTWVAYIILLALSGFFAFGVGLLIWGLQFIVVTLGWFAGIGYYDANFWSLLSIGMILSLSGVLTILGVTKVINRLHELGSKNYQTLPALSKHTSILDLLHTIQDILGIELVQLMIAQGEPIPTTNTFPLILAQRTRFIYIIIKILERKGYSPTQIREWFDQENTEALFYRENTPRKVLIKCWHPHDTAAIKVYHAAKNALPAQSRPQP